MEQEALWQLSICWPNSLSNHLDLTQFYTADINLEYNKMT